MSTKIKKEVHRRTELYLLGFDLTYIHPDSVERIRNFCYLSLENPTSVIGRNKAIKRKKKIHTTTERGHANKLRT